MKKKKKKKEKKRKTKKNMFVNSWLNHFLFPVRHSLIVRMKHGGRGFLGLLPTLPPNY